MDEGWTKDGRRMDEGWTKDERRMNEGCSTSERISRMCVQGTIEVRTGFDGRVVEVDLAEGERRGKAVKILPFDGWHIS